MKKKRSRKKRTSGNVALMLAAPNAKDVAAAEEAIKRICRDRSLTARERVAALNAIGSAAQRPVTITNCHFETNP